MNDFQSQKCRQKAFKIIGYRGIHTYTYIYFLNDIGTTTIHNMFRHSSAMYEDLKTIHPGGIRT
jgi:hypothetical protein